MTKTFSYFKFLFHSRASGNPVLILKHWIPAYAGMKFCKTKPSPITITNHQSGYSLIELMLAIVVGSVVLAGTYASYSIVGTQFQKNEGKSEMRASAIPTLKILGRDLRRAGYKAVDTAIESTLGRISTPIAITDSGNACCDSVQIIFDEDTSTRRRYTYFVAARSNPTRSALFLNIDTYTGGTWVATRANEVVADYVEDFQVVGSDNNTDGFPTLVDISLVLRSKTPAKSVNSFTKSSASVGNYNYSFSDNFLREEFASTVIIRNLLEKTY
jgi:prepilin-type N-terminal cleavage/methylation domain-containing protein